MTIYAQFVIGRHGYDTVIADTPRGPVKARGKTPLLDLAKKLDKRYGEEHLKVYDHNGRLVAVDNIGGMARVSEDNYCRKLNTLPSMCRHAYLGTSHIPPKPEPPVIEKPAHTTRGDQGTKLHRSPRGRVSKE